MPKTDTNLVTVLDSDAVSDTTSGSASASASASASDSVNDRVNDPASSVRRLRLRVLAKLMVLCAFLAIIYVGVAGFTVSNKPGSSVSALRVPLEGIEPGSMKTLVWGSRPVLIYHRSSEDIARLGLNDDRLRDPASKKSEQPPFADNEFRSRNPQWFIAIALGTDLGCSLDYVPATDSYFQRELWMGGFVDSCRKARYDLAGRVYSDQFATENLAVPDYSIDENTLVLGQL